MMIIASLLICTLFVVSGSSYYYARQFLASSLDATEASVASDYSFRIKAGMDMLIAQLEDLASIARLQSGDKVQIAPALLETHKRIGKFESILFASLDGLSINESNGVVNVVDREYFKKVMTIKKP
jgi:methyl-accepting chemotaxis protein